VTRHYHLAGVADDLTAKTELESSLPSTYDGLELKSIKFEPIWVDSDAGDGLWDCRATYVQVGERPPETGDSRFSFDTGGGTQHITQSLETISSHAPAGETAPDHKGAIGYTGESVEGTDITVASYQFTETHYIASASVDAAYKSAIFELTGKVNNASFKGLAAGECLFLGATGSQRGDGEDWEITFAFAGSPNQTGLTVGDITGIDKKGWEYLWVQYGDDEDDTAHALLKRPIAAYVERVYEAGDFSSLGIGT
jgi:hypothetical protein